MCRQAEELKGERATARVSAGFPIVQESSAEKPRAITEEERNFGAYTALRKARSDARFVGVREKRQKKKDEEAAAKKA